MSELFSPLNLRGVTLRNRIGAAPMAMFSSVEGRPGDWQFMLLGGLAVGGSGLVMSEATAVSPSGRITPRDAGLWSDDHIPAWKRITSFVSAQGAIPGVQLAHAGRKASTMAPWEGGGPIPVSEGGWERYAPSPIPFGGLLTGEPREMTLADIRRVQGEFRAAARLALEAGFLWLEIHGAHGYLLHSFLSPLSNHRRDEYGGELRNRARFLCETVQAVREVWPAELPLAVRLSSSDWVPGGWMVHESVEVAGMLRRLGVDLIDVSTGGSVPDKKIYPVGPGYMVPHAERIRRESVVPVAVAGMIWEPMQADEVVRNGRADVVLLARELLRDPHWPLRAARALNRQEALKLPPQIQHWI